MNFKTLKKDSLSLLKLNLVLALIEVLIIGALITILIISASMFVNVIAIILFLVAEFFILYKFQVKYFKIYDENIDNKKNIIIYQLILIGIFFIIILIAISQFFVTVSHSMIPALGVIKAFSKIEKTIKISSFILGIGAIVYLTMFLYKIRNTVNTTIVTLFLVVYNVVTKFLIQIIFVIPQMILVYLIMDGSYIGTFLVGILVLIIGLILQSIIQAFAFIVIRYFKEENELERKIRSKLKK